jgi:glycerol kinase
MMLVVDVGTTSLRAALVDADASIRSLHQRAFRPSSPAPGLVEFDAAELARHVLQLSELAIADAGSASVTAVGITNQRASTVVWDRRTGEPIGPAIGWQDLRTVGECIMAKAEHGLAIAPNQTVTKAAWVLANTSGARERDLCIGTVDSWVAWTLSAGALHVTDRSNASVTGLCTSDASSWNAEVGELLGVPTTMLPAIVDSCGAIGEASALTGAPLIAAIAGDQQASLVGQGCVRPGDAKITFGTGGMLDVCTGVTAPARSDRSEHGTFPIVAWSRDGAVTWGVEAIMLSAGSNVEWLCEDLGLIDDPADSHAVASRCETTDGVVFVPALLGLGTPWWDYGARGTLLGITRGTERPHVVRAVLEGVAHRGADMVDAAIADTGLDIAVLRIDGGMSANPTFVQALADATGRPVEVSPVVEATTVGAAYLAGIATGTWDDFEDAAASWRPVTSVDPGADGDRARWAEAVARSRSWIPELSALDF